MLKFAKSKTFLKAAIALAIPIALQNLLVSILNIFDQIMVGWLPADVAENAMSAVLLANQIVFIYQNTLFAVCNTVIIFLAQYTENGKQDLIPQRVGLVLKINIGIAVVMTILCAGFPNLVIGIFSPNAAYAQLAADYLRMVAVSFVPMSIAITLSATARAVKKLGIPLIANSVGVAMNIFFNYVFMFGFGRGGFGLIGAAYGTIASRCIEFALLLVLLIAKRSPILASPKVMIRGDGKFLKEFLKDLFPILCNETFWVLSSTAYLFVYDKLPNSEIVLSAIDIANAVDKLISVMMIGVGSAIGVLISNSLASSDANDAVACKTMSLEFALFTGILIALLTLGAAFVAPFAFLHVSAETRRVATILLCLYAATAIVRTLVFALVVGILRSGGDNTFCVVYETLCIWCVSVPLVFLAGLLWGANIYVLYLLSCVADVLKLIGFYARSRTTKWMRLRLSDTAVVAAASTADLPDTEPTAETEQPADDKTEPPTPDGRD